MTEEKKRYSFNVDTDKYADVKKDLEEEFKKLDENNPLEQAKKYREVKKNPPLPGFMGVELFEGVSNGEPTVKSVSSMGSFNEEPFFTVDLNTLIQADIARSPSNVVPMLIDQAVRLAMDERKEFKPEKRREGFNYWWIIIVLLMLPGIILIILMFL